MSSSLDWDTFDFVEKKPRVEEGEYSALIENIENSDLYLVDSVNDDESDETNDTHPALRKRIRFLHRNITDLNSSQVL